MKKLYHQIHDNSRYLPEDLLLEIFLLLDAEDLANFKHVSKYWHSLICNTDFGHTHFSLHPPSQSQYHHILFSAVTMYFSISLVNNNLMQPPKPFPLPKSLRAASLRASCDGLLLFQGTHNPQQLYIFNPLTSRLHTLPLLTSRYPCYHWALVRDTLIGRYKVMAILSLVHIAILIFCDDSSWYYHLSDKPRSTVPFMALSQLTLFHKELCWLIIEEDGDGQQCYCLYALHVETLTLRKKPIPTDDISYHFNLVKRLGLHLLVELNGGSLGVVIVSPYRLRMFVFKDMQVGLELTPKYHTITIFSLSDLPRLANGFLTEDTCLIAVRGGLHANGSDTNLFGLLRILMHREDRLLIYDLNTQETRLIGFLSKKQKLSREYLFHSNSLATWD